MLRRAQPFVGLLVGACIVFGVVLLCADFFSFGGTLAIRPLCQESMSVDLNPHVVDAVSGPPGEVWEKDWKWDKFDTYNPFDHTHEDYCSAPSGHKLTQRIPKIVHYVFGMRPDFGGKPFNFVHYLGVLSVHKRIRPKAIYLHFLYEPKGLWWEKAKALVTLVKARNVTAMYGHTISNPAHQADIIRLELLQRWGGIYLDLDVLVFQPFDSLLHNTFVIGYEGGPEYGMGNSVMLSKPQSKFATHWLATYAAFSDQADWAEHSIFMPRRLAIEMPKEVCVMPPHAFLFPLWSDHGREVMYSELDTSEAENVTVTLRGADGKQYRALYPGQYAFHIAETAAWAQLKHYNFNYIKRNPTSRMALLMRDLVWDRFDDLPDTPADSHGEGEEGEGDAAEDEGHSGETGDSSGDGERSLEATLREKISQAQAQAKAAVLREELIKLWSEAHPEASQDEQDVVLEQVKEFARADRRQRHRSKRMRAS
ncbi:hypothetical protein WJX72_010448 [[Myrmecia] bisecta]|uniref:Glycosyltransferase family 32 protein n=1 Tax=[Myrmecia] bisecta TaxID=41462 RepID=A0AAW1QGQ5_9CHLO